VIYGIIKYFRKSVLAYFQDVRRNITHDWKNVISPNNIFFIFCGQIVTEFVVDKIMQGVSASTCFSDRPNKILRCQRAEMVVRGLAGNAKASRHQ